MSAREVRIELLSPAEIDAAMAERPVVYVPLGTYEFHGAHLPIGLDALSAHGICLAAAERDGGVVCPPLYYGTGGGHGAYPWTIMVEPEPILSLLRTTIAQLAKFGVRQVVLMSGHFPGEQIEMIQALAAEARAEGTVRVDALSVAMARLALAPDHAAIFETTLLGALRPELVHVERLPPLESAPAIDPNGNSMGPQRHEKSHPLYGIFGPDPRHYDPAAAQPLLKAMVDWVVGRVRDQTS
ncbi:MAG: creatininase family protein [Devosia sp.]